MNTPRPGPSSTETPLDRILAQQVQDEEAGLPSRSPSELIALHPEMASELRAYFANRQHVERQVAPLRVEAPLAVPATATASEAAALPMVPGYEVLGELGRGGMGVVYKARQQTPERLVALKMVLAGASADPAELGRFRGESEAIARIQHPNIVQVYEVGTHQGLPYFSMEYVEGGTLADRIKAELPEPRQAAAIIFTLATAVHEAHQRGIVHRDLKPANVLLKDGLMPKISDFGLAKRLDVDLGQTESGAIVGTPSYMAPEQARGESKQATVATDVYALGAILYELLTGKPPFRAATPLDTLLQVIADEPVPVRRMQTKVPHDLETICLKCLEKKPENRYAGAQVLASELRHFLAGEPILARPVGMFKRIMKWASRRPAAAALAVVSSVALAAVALLLLVHHFEVRSHNEQLGKVNDDLATSLVESEKRRKEAMKSARAEAEARAAEAEAYKKERRQWRTAEHRLYINDMRTAFHDLELRFHFRGGQFLRAYLPKEGQPDFRSFEWYYLWQLNHGPGQILRPEGGLLSAVFSPDGKSIALCGFDKGMATGLLWSPGVKERKRILEGAEGLATRVFYSADHKLCACLSQSNHRVTVWDVTAKKSLTTIRDSSDPVSAVCLTRNRQTVVTVGNNGTLRLWDADGRPLGTLQGSSGTIHAEGLAPDGKVFATTGADGTVHLWDLEAKKEIHVLRGHTDTVLALAFSTDGKTLATAGKDGTARLWDVASGRPVSMVFGHDHSPVHGVGLSPDGQLLATSAENRAVRLWHIESGQEWKTFILPGEPLHYLRSLSFSADGKFLLGHDFQTVRLLDLQRPPSQTSLLTVHPFKDSAIPAQTTALTLSPDDSRVAAAISQQSGFSFKSAVQVWETKTGKEFLRIDWPNGIPRALAFSSDGRTMCAGGSRLEGIGESFVEVKLWDVSAQRELATLSGPRGQVLAASFSPDGKLLATAGGDNLKNTALLVLRNPATGQEWKSLTGHKNVVTALTFTPDGSMLISGSADGTVRWWDTRTWKEIHVINVRGCVSSVTLSRDAAVLAVTTGNLPSLFQKAEGDVLLFQIQEKGEPRRLRSHPSGYRQVAFTPDGQTLASVDGDGAVPLWVVERGEELVRLGRIGSSGHQVAFTSRQPTLVTAGSRFSLRSAGGPAEVRLWHAATEEDVRNRLSEDP